MKSALILIDFQNDYFKGGAMELVNSEIAAENALSVLNYFRGNAVPIIHIQHVALRRDAKFFLPETHGAAIYDLLKPYDNEKVIIKHKPNSFMDTELLEYLRVRDIKKLVITGMMTQVCIDATVRAGKDFGFDIMVISDCCAARDLEYAGNKIPAEDVQNSFLAAMSYYYADVINSSEFFDHNKFD